MTADSSTPKVARYSVLGSALCVLVVMGFFAFIFLWHRGPLGEASRPPPMTESEKMQVMQSLAKSNANTPEISESSKLNILGKLQGK